MKGLSIYTIIIYGLGTMGLFSEPDYYTFIGWIALTPIFIFAILYLVKDAKEKRNANNKSTSEASRQSAQS
jgi:hypothetical protein